MMRTVKTLADAEMVCRDLDDKVNALLSKSLNLSGRRILNVGAALEPGDAVNFGQLVNFINRLEQENRSLKETVAKIERRLIDGGL